MKCTLQRWVWSIAFFAAAGCAHHADVTRESTQTDYGVSMAKMSLWREAMFRFKRAVQMNPGDPMAHNNLAVAYEANGDFENARHEYLEALRLDRSNDYIKKNYSRFVEFLSRNKKRTTTGTKAAGSGTVAPATMPVAGGTAVSGESPRPPDKPIGADPGALPRPPQPMPQPTPQPPPTPPPGVPSQEGAV
jgi:tetratricopeptide (TPR) repeat protein